MQKPICAGILAALALTGIPGHAQETRILNTPNNISVAFEEAHAEDIDRGFDLIGKRQPAQAIEVFDTIIGAYEAQHTEGLVFCSRDSEQSMQVAAIALLTESTIENATVLGPSWCAALFGKGFALIDLKRPEDAAPLLSRAVEMAPLNAHYRNELAELYKNRREWQRSFDIFEEAYELAQRPISRSSPQMVARALRGMGYCKIEMGELNEAKSLFVLSQQHDPDNAGAKTELEYIASLQAAAG